MNPSQKNQATPKTAEEIQAFLVERLASALRTTPDQIDINEDVATYGLDSLDAMNIVGQLSEWCGQDIGFDVLWDYPTIAAVADFVAKELNKDAA